MATINYEYCKSEVLYNSGDVEEELLEIYKTGKKATIKDNPNYFYAVTSIRENIIGWYNFKKDSTILEVGGGLGSITGALCKAAKKVISNEYSKRRAENIYYRHKECDNLEVIVGNLNDIEFKEKFDYIVLIGVFEYAKRFCKTDNPFNDFLKKMKSLLKKDGVILIAIENRYGIKYFAGAPEDHYGKRFLGLSGYEKYDIQTFGKKELDTIIHDSGFKNIKYYYPYPDYKIPYIIHTDAKLPSMSEINSLKLYNHDNSLYAFDYRHVLGGLIENEQYGFFANSYIVEMSNSLDAMSNIIYSKTFWIRDEKYQIYTNILSNKDIYKLAKNEKSLVHIKNIYDINCKLQKIGIKVPKIDFMGNSIKIEYIDGPILTDVIASYVKQRRYDLVYNELDKYVKFLNSFARLKNINKKAVNAENYFDGKRIKVLRLNVFDIHTSNIVVKNDEYYLIDQEWKSAYDIPLNYVLYFSLYYLFEWIADFGDFFTKDEIFKKYNLTTEEITIYEKMSDFFAKKELGTVDNDVMQIVNQQNTFKTLENELKCVQDGKNKLSVELKNTQEDRDNLNNQIEKLKQEQKAMIEMHSQEVKILNDSYNELINSTSWKVTKPFRKISAILRKK